MKRFAAIEFKRKWIMPFCSSTHLASDWCWTLHLSLRSIYDCQIGWWTSPILISLAENFHPFIAPAKKSLCQVWKKTVLYVFSSQNHIFPKYCDASEILWRYLRVLCHIKKIIGSLSLSILFSPNSNSFPLNSNIADTQWSKNPFSYTDKDRRKRRYVFYVSGKSPNLPISLLVRS